MLCGPKSSLVKHAAMMNQGLPRNNQGLARNNQGLARNYHDLARNDLVVGSVLRYD